VEAIGTRIALPGVALTAVGQRGNDLLRNLRQQQLRFGQRQTQISDFTKTIRPADRNHVETSRLTDQSRSQPNVASIARMTRLGWGQIIDGCSAPILLNKVPHHNSRDRLICVGAPESDEDSRSSVRAFERC
jgi:hypothetical protein